MELIRFELRRGSGEPQQMRLSVASAQVDCQLPERADGRDVRRDSSLGTLRSSPPAVIFAARGEEGIVVQSFVVLWVSIATQLRKLAQPRFGDSDREFWTSCPKWQQHVELSKVCSNVPANDSCACIKAGCVAQEITAGLTACFASYQPAAGNQLFPSDVNCGQAESEELGTIIAAATTAI
ncbi:unnamed protein product [Symbiodinium sp. CCMP2592]|nr:unnamed protein product [Symbiodinium sp. CCMP2592]